MSMPDVAAVTTEWYEALGRETDDDQDLGWPLLIYLDSIGRLLQAVEDIVRDDDQGNPGWSVILDVDNAPAGGLAWLGQMVGVQTLSNLTDDENRVRIQSTSGQKRGTPQAIRAAAQQFMSGTKSVTFFEREGGAYRFRVRVFASEVTNTTAMTTALQNAKPAGLLMTIEISAGLSYDELGSRYADSDAMSATSMTYDQLADLT